MPKKILLIESDTAFASELTEALESATFEVRATADGKEGLDFARDWAPDAVVLCVELPRMSGYVICQKLKKDDVLKAIPLVLTSSEATPDTFEKHKQLKVRAESYLIKPFAPPALLDALAAIGVEGERAPDDEEVVSLEDDVGLDALATDPAPSVPALDLDGLPDEPAPGGAFTASGDDEDLRLLDDAFGAASPPRAPAHHGVALEIEGEHPVSGDEVDAAAASLPELDDAPARADIAHLEEDADRALGSLADDDGAAESPFEAAPRVDRAPPHVVRGASADRLRAAGIAMLDEPARPAARGDDGAAEDDAELGETEAELRESRAQLEVAVRRAEAAEATSAAKDAEMKALRARADALAAQAKKAEADAKAAREDSRRAVDRARAAESRAREAEEALAEARRRVDASQEQARAKTEALEREVDELKTELVVARGEAEGARGEIERQSNDLGKRIDELQAAASKNEERVLKAYQKIKADEKMRDKVRKALAVAQQVLEDGLEADLDGDAPRASIAGGRD